jgi:type IV secretory pathway VirB2 component (pilin)
MNTNSARRISRNLRHLFSATLTVVVAGLASTAHAASAGMPWEGPLQQIVASLTGPVAKALGVAAIVITGLSMALSESARSHGKLLGIIFGLSIVFTAGNFILPMLGFSGGLAL